MQQHTEIPPRFTRKKVEIRSYDRNSQDDPFTPHKIESKVQSPTSSETSLPSESSQNSLEKALGTLQVSFEANINDKSDSKLDRLSVESSQNSLEKALGTLQLSFE